MVNGLNLDEIRQAMEDGETETFAPVRLYVVNHMAEVDWPRKYVYQACPRRIAGFGPHGRFCGRTLEGWLRCAVPPNQEIGVDTYRFHIFLSDGLTGGRPLQVTIFDATASLTGVPAESFKKLCESSQVDKVTSTILCMLEYQATLRVHKGVTYVQSMTLIGGVAPKKYYSRSPWPNDPVEREFNLAPHRLSLFDEYESTMDSAGSSNAAVKEKVAELVDLIAQSLTGRGKE